MTKEIFIKIHALMADITSFLIISQWIASFVIIEKERMKEMLYIWITRK